MVLGLVAMGNSLSKERLLGEAGEHMVASQLLLNGINVYFPAIDEGADIMASNGARIQVKSSHSEYSNTRGYKYPTYLFCTRKKKYINSRNVTVRPKIAEGSLDFMVLWCVDHNWFFVIPEKDILKTQFNITIGTVESGDSKYMKYLNAWHLIKEFK